MRTIVLWSYNLNGDVFPFSSGILMPWGEGLSPLPTQNLASESSSKLLGRESGLSGCDWLALQREKAMHDSCIRLNNDLWHEREGEATTNWHSSSDIPRPKRQTLRWKIKECQISSDRSGIIHQDMNWTIINTKRSQLCGHDSCDA